MPQNYRNREIGFRGAENRLHQRCAETDEVSDGLESFPTVSKRTEHFLQIHSFIHDFRSTMYVYVSPETSMQKISAIVMRRDRTFMHETNRKHACSKNQRYMHRKFEYMYASKSIYRRRPREEPFELRLQL